METRRFAWGVMAFACWWGGLLIGCGKTKPDVAGVLVDADVASLDSGADSTAVPIDGADLQTDGPAVPDAPDGGVANDRTCPPHPLTVEGCGCGSRWLRVLDQDREDRVTAITGDASGNLIAAGLTRGTIANRAPYIWIRKYDQQGGESWTRTFDGRMGDGANGIAADAVGNVIVTGYTAGERWIRKYDPDGAARWTLSGGPERQAITIDKDGNVLVTAPHVGATKYDSATGIEYWTGPPAAGVSTQSFTTGIASDSDGNVVVVGSVRQSDGPIGTENWGTDIWVRKIDPAGAALWTRTYDGGRDDWASTVAVDGQNNVLVAGRSYLKGGNGALSYVGWLRKYSPAGIELWTRTEENTGPRELGSQMVVDASGRIFVAWLHVSQYDGQGTLVNMRPCRAERLAVDGRGTVFLGGTVLRPVPNTFMVESDVWLGSYVW